MHVCLRMFVWCVLGVLPVMWSGCQSGPTEEGSRREYDYVPPVLPTPTPPPTVESSEETGEEETPPSKGFFARLFSGDDEEVDSADVARVGDEPETSVADGQEEPVQPAGPSDHVYRLKNGDTVYITLTGPQALNEQIETRVDDEGAVKLRFIGSVDAAGLTTTQLEREIELEYTERQKIYRDITVRVVVPNTFYFIGGEVQQPGRFPLMGRVTLSQAVVSAGNFTEWANPRKVVLVRNNERVEIDYREIVRNPNLDVVLLAGDVITVTRSTF